MKKIIIDTDSFTTQTEDFFYDKEALILKFKCSYDGAEYTGKNVLCRIENMADTVIIRVSDMEKEND